MADQDVALQDEWADRSTPLQEDMRFQRRFWGFQRAGWVLVSLLLAATVLGLFSEGPLSWTVTRAGDGTLAIEHERFLRSGASTSMTIRLGGERAGPEHVIVISHSLLQTLTFETVQPEPVRAETHPDGLHLTFAAPGDGDSAIYIALRPEAAGFVDGAIAIGGSDAQARLRLFVYP